MEHRSALTIIAVATVILASCAPSDSASSTDDQPSASLASPSSSVGPTIPPSPTPQASPQALTPVAAEILVDGLTLRGGPGKSAPAIACDRNDGKPVQLDADSVVGLLDEIMTFGYQMPVEADGYSWHPVVANATYPDGSPSGAGPCHEVPTLVGWVAGGTTHGPWLRPIVPCPDIPTDVEGLSRMSSEPLLALGCFSQQPMTVEGSYPAPAAGIGFSCPGIEPAWLTCSLETIGGVRVRVPPTLTMPSPGGSIVVTGHFDDPAAADCVPADLKYVPQVSATFYCRTQFVLDAARPAG